MDTMRLLSLLAIGLLLESSLCFIAPSRRTPFYSQGLVSLLLQPSKVVDPDGATPDAPDDAPTLIDPKDIPELHYNEDDRPIPHQPWRRGSTNGCEDPIDAPWRLQAHRLISQAAEMVNGRVVDITWYLTQVVITVDDESLSEVDEYTMGPEIVISRDGGPEYFDPDDPNPEPIYADEEEFLFERDEEETQELLRRNSGGSEIPENPVELHVAKETREDMAAPTEQEEALQEMEEQPVEYDDLLINTPALSTIARAILQALETVEDDIHVLERHDVILTSPGDPTLLESQSQFDNHQGGPVIVETQDPFGSNRVLKGRLLMRNSMDVVINKKGRMVTIPLNFVKAVRIPSGDAPFEDPEEDED